MHLVWSYIGRFAIGVPENSVIFGLGYEDIRFGYRNEYIRTVVAITAIGTPLKQYFIPLRTLGIKYTYLLYIPSQ